MAYGDVSMFRPSSGGDPDRDVMMSEARQRADYLSQMDIFYEQLGFQQEQLAEETRRFDVTAEQHAEEQEWMQDYYGAQLEYESSLALAQYQSEYGPTSEAQALIDRYAGVPSNQIPLSVRTSLAAAYQTVEQQQPQAIQYNPDTDMFY